MHILILPSWYPNKNSRISGIFFKEQAEALAKQNLKIGCISINESSLRYIFSKKEVSFDYYDKNINGVQTIGLMYPIANRFKNLRKFIRLIIFKRLFKKYIYKYGKPDLIHLHSFLYGEFAIWIKKTYNINYIVTEHSSGFARKLYTKNELAYAKKIFSNSKYNIAVSNEFKKTLEKLYSIKFYYIPNPINTDFFVPSIKKDNKFKFINIGFLNKNKNQDMLIKAFTKAFGKNEDILLTTVGSGEEYNNLSTLIKELNMQNRIKLYGEASREEVLKLLQASDRFVLSSKYETFGVAVIEAMSCALPVVATKCKGPESIIVNNNLGKLVDINIDSLANGMVESYNSNYDKSYIRKYAVDNFSYKAVTNKLLKVYKKCIKIN